MGEGLFGMEIRDLPEGWTALEYCAVIKCLDETGDMALAFRFSPGTTTWDRVGMLRSAEATELVDLTQKWQDENDG